MSYKSEHLLEQIKLARAASGQSQRALAQRTGLTQSHISKIESAALEPGLSSFIDLARALDLEPMLIPRKMIPAVQAIVRAPASSESEPQRAYLPEEEENDA